MSASLDRLVSNVSDFPHLERHMDHADLFKRKGVFPYEYCTSFDVFDGTLPPIQAFHSSLNDTDITPDDYAHAQKVYELCNNFGDYHDLYLKSDVLLLADVLSVSAIWRSIRTV